MIPAIVGTIKEVIVHFQLFVSFFIVRSVVAQGKCIRLNSMVLTHVSQVQLWAVKMALNSAGLSILIMDPVDI